LLWAPQKLVFIKFISKKISKYENNN